MPEDVGVSRKVLDEDYILQVALLDPAARGDLEKRYIEPFFDIDQGGLIPTVDDYRDVRVAGSPAARRAPVLCPRQAGRVGADSPTSGVARTSTARDLEDEFVYRNSVRLNHRTMPRWAISGPSSSPTPGT